MNYDDAILVARVLGATIHAADVNMDQTSEVEFVKNVAVGMARKCFPEFDWQHLVGSASDHCRELRRAGRV